MSGSNLQLARELYDAFARGDISAATGLLDPGFEMETPTGTPEEGTYTGYESATRHLQAIMEPFHDIRVEPEEFIEAGDQEVVVTVHVSGTGKASGLAIDTRFAHLVTIRNGRVMRLQAFFDKKDALRAAKRSN